MANHARTVQGRFVGARLVDARLVGARSVSAPSDTIAGHGIVLGGLGIAFGILLWMASGGSLPFDFGPLSGAAAGSNTAEFAASGLQLAAVKPPLHVVLQ